MSKGALHACSCQDSYQRNQETIHWDGFPKKTMHMGAKSTKPQTVDFSKANNAMGKTRSRNYGNKTLGYENVIFKFSCYVL